MASYELTCEQCREADRIAIDQYGIPGIVLMENAGRSCVEMLLGKTTANSSVVLCGPGNNGGDGFVIARHLLGSGRRVKVLLLSSPERYTGDALINLKILANLRVPIIEVSEDWTEQQIRNALFKVGRLESDCIVDAMLGTGSTGSPRSPMDHVIRMGNQLDVYRMAVDIPTGMNGNTGEAVGDVFRADLTCTFIALKPGFKEPAGRSVAGEVECVDIGLPDIILRQLNE